YIHKLVESRETISKRNSSFRKAAVGLRLVASYFKAAAPNEIRFHKQGRDNAYFDGDSRSDVAKYRVDWAKQNDAITQSNGTTPY
ncbi:hypothetical protein CU098_012223, partial [Rhizopus stolonifer]